MMLVMNGPLAYHQVATLHHTTASFHSVHAALPVSCSTAPCRQDTTAWGKAQLQQQAQQQPAQFNVDTGVNCFAGLETSMFIQHVHTPSVSGLAVSSFLHS